jgi:hypothetical protein
VLQAGACVVPAAGMTVYVASGSATSASTLITTRSGSAIAYFTAAGGRVPSQALVTSSGGKATRVYYGKDGALQKIVNQKTGEYLSIKMRSDVLGADYLLFNSSGKFQSGYTLYRSGSDWFQARVLGDFGQFTGNFSGAVSGSFALKSPRLVYASPTRLDPRLSQILNGEFAQSLSFGAGVLDLLIPSAHAIGLNPLDKGNLYSGMALMIMGGVLGGPTNPAGALLMVGGAVQIYRGLAGNLDRNIESISQSVTQIMEDHAANDLASGTEPVASMNNSLVGILARGFNSLKDKVTAKLDRLSGGFGGQPAPQSAPDTSVASQPLPFVAEDHTPLEGSMVDTQNRIYNATGTINANGEFSASGDSSDKLKLNIAGKVEPGKTTSTACAQTNASGQTLKTCTVAPGSVVEPIGVCQTSTQSGGNGTFSYAYNLGASEGSFNLSYDMYSIADAMTVVGGGRVLFTTNGLVSGSRSMTVTYSGGASAIVNLSAPTSGTQWTFTVGCGS